MFLLYTARKSNLKFKNGQKSWSPLQYTLQEAFLAMASTIPTVGFSSNSNAYTKSQFAFKKAEKNMTPCMAR